MQLVSRKIDLYKPINYHRAKLTFTSVRIARRVARRLHLKALVQASRPIRQSIHRPLAAPL